MNAKRLCPLPSRASVESEGKMAAEGAVTAAQHIDKEHCNIDWIANQSYQKGKRIRVVMQKRAKMTITLKIDTHHWDASQYERYSRVAHVSKAVRLEMGLPKL
jgi:hypothetical protein